MTKKDYELIAMAINNAYFTSDTELEYSGIKSVIDHLVIDLSADNPKFDADRFRKVCTAHIMYQVKQD